MDANGTQQILAAIEKIKQDFGTKLNDIKSSMEEMETRITNNISETINKNMDSLQLEVDQLRSEKQYQEIKIEKLERQLRKRNLILFGVAEEELSYNDLVKLISGPMELELSKLSNWISIQFVKRLGPKKENKTRPVLITFTTMGKKIECLQNKHKLKETACYIKEDYPKDVIEKRKELQLELIKYKEEGIKATIRYDKLIVLSKNNKRALPSSPENETTKEASRESTKPTVSTKTTNYEQANKKNKTAKYSPQVQRSMSTFVQSRPNYNKQDNIINATKETTTINKSRKSRVGCPSLSQADTLNHRDFSEM